MTKTKNFGYDHEQIVKDFRRVLESHTRVFEATRDHVRTLLGTSQNYHSGIFREGLLRSFLKNVLPAAICVDTGFVYGFGEVKTSGQLDILIWDPRHPPVYRTPEFVIVPPEAAIAGITVKTNMTGEDIDDGIRNLMSLSLIDQTFRAPTLPPIVKLLISFHAPKSAETARAKIGATCSSVFLSESEFTEAAVPILRDFDPINPSQEHSRAIERIFPKLFATIDSTRISFVQGWGPPTDKLGTERHGPLQLRRVPWVYQQTNVLTTPLEKLVFYALRSCYLATNAPAGSLLSAWADLNPVAGMRIGDTSEVEEEKGTPLLDADALKTPSAEIASEE